MLVTEVNTTDINSLRSMADIFRDKLGSAVVVLGAKNEDKVNFVATVTKDLIPKGIHAGNIIKEVAKKLVVAVVVALIWLRLEVSYQRKPKKL